MNFSSFSHKYHLCFYCSGYNHPPKFCLSLFWSLPTNLTQHFVLLRQVLKLQCFPRTKTAHQSQSIHSPHRLFTGTWSNCSLSNFPFKIAHFWRVASLPSRNCAIIFGSSLDSRIAQSYQLTLPTGFAQFP